MVKGKFFFGFEKNLNNRTFLRKIQFFVKIVLFNEFAKSI